MLHGMQNSAAGALLQDAKVNTHTNNMANANTTGYHKDFVLFRDRRPASEEHMEFRFKNSMLDKMHGGMFLQGQPFDRTHGPIEQTGRKLDVAIKGDGFFRVSDGENKFLTRAGNFKRNKNGELVTGNGKYKVLNPDGEAIELNATNDVEINQEGTIFQNNEEVDQLGLVKVSKEDMGKMEKIGENRFTLNDQSVAEPFQGQVVNGALEGSNVQTVKEMTGMMKAQQLYDQNFRALEMQDSTLEQAINQVGSISA